MLAKLEDITARYDELEDQLSRPETLADMQLYTKLSREHAETEELVQTYRTYRRTESEMNAALAEAEKESGEMRDMLLEEAQSCRERLAQLQTQLRMLLLPKDRNDERGCTLEIRAGAGGEEAALFAYELYRMYQSYCEKHRFSWETVDLNMTELGGVKEAIVNIEGRGAYARLKYESGVHRVQRVPETESQGRIHTSTVTVAVLPEAEDVEGEILEKDLKIDAYRAGGAGGQYVNKTESAIRITHLPTGIVVTCQDEKSQGKNKESAMKVLKSRVYDYYRTQQEKEYASSRKMLVGTGDRSERIRTYNFPQGRVTDHRIGLTLYSLDAFLDGDLFEMLDALALANRNEMLSSGA